MKLLTTIAAVLISISAFSQDYIEYDNGTFTQNGEELSMEQIDDLTVLHKAGRGNVRRGNKFDLMYKDGDLRARNNVLNSIAGAGVLTIGLQVVSLGLLVYSFADEPRRFRVGIPIMVAGVGVCAFSFKSFYKVSTSSGSIRKRDKQFNKVVDKLNKKVAYKLNQAIKAANQ